MFPVLGRGSVARVVLCSFEDIHPGDIAVFKAKIGFICHRVLKKVYSQEGLFLKTKGDISRECDCLVRQEAFIGKVVSFKKVGLNIHIDNFFCRAAGFCFGYFLPFLIRPFLALKSTLIRYDAQPKT